MANDFNHFKQRALRNQYPVYPFRIPANESAIVAAGPAKLPDALKFLARIGFIAVLLLAMILTSGCGYYKQEFSDKSGRDYGSRNQYASEQDMSEQELDEGERLYGLQISGGKNHHNKELTYSQRLSDEISRIPGIMTSIVMLTDKNAYVAIVLDGSATGMFKDNGRNRREVDNTGTTRGMYDPRTGSQYMDPNKLVDDTNSYYTVDDHHDLSRKLKQTIAKRIRELEPNLAEVHISANKDFINQMNVYARDARGGKSIQSFLPEFNEVVTHYFGVKP